MEQSIVQLPFMAFVKFRVSYVRIRNHKVINHNGLFGAIRTIILREKADRQILTKFEKHGINFEAVIEYCANELEDDSRILADMIRWGYGIRGQIKDGVYMKECNDFSKSPTGRPIADMFVDNIRDCRDWQELYDELHPQSTFSKHMTKKIHKEMTQWLKT